MRLSQLCGCPQAGSSEGTVSVSPYHPMLLFGSGEQLLLGLLDISFVLYRKRPLSLPLHPIAPCVPRVATWRRHLQQLGPHDKGGRLLGSKSPRMDFVASPSRHSSSHMLFRPLLSAFPNYLLSSCTLILRPSALTGWAARRRWSLSWILGCKKICQ